MKNILKISTVHCQNWKKRLMNCKKGEIDLVRSVRGIFFSITEQRTLLQKRKNTVTELTNMEKEINKILSKLKI